METLNCLLSGLIHLLGPVLVLYLWRKKTGAKVYPALVALAAAFFIFFAAGVVRSGFITDKDSFVVKCIKNAVLYGVFEEGGKFLVMRFALSEYITRKESVPYGVGHGCFENLTAGLACLQLIGQGTASPYILGMTTLSFVEGTLYDFAAAVILYYGIANKKSGLILPLVMLFHALSNIAGNLFILSVSIPLRLILTTAGCIIAHRLWKAIDEPL